VNLNFANYVPGQTRGQACKILRAVRPDSRLLRFGSEAKELLILNEIALATIGFTSPVALNPDFTY